MKKQTISKTLLTVMFGAVMVSGSAMAESMTVTNGAKLIHPSD